MQSASPSWPHFCPASQLHVWVMHNNNMHSWVSMGEPWFKVNQIGNWLREPLSSLHIHYNFREAQPFNYRLRSREIMYLVASVHPSFCPCSPGWTVWPYQSKVCVCNQWAYTDNCAERMWSISFYSNIVSLFLSFSRQVWWFKDRIKYWLFFIAWLSID